MSRTITKRLKTENHARSRIAIPNEPRLGRTLKKGGEHRKQTPTAAETRKTEKGEREVQGDNSKPQTTLEQLTRMKRRKVRKGIHTRFELVDCLKKKHRKRSNEAI